MKKQFFGIKYDIHIIFILFILSVILNFDFNGYWFIPGSPILALDITNFFSIIYIAFNIKYIKINNYSKLLFILVFIIILSIIKGFPKYSISCYGEGRYQFSIVYSIVGLILVGKYGSYNLTKHLTKVFILLCILLHLLYVANLIFNRKLAFVFFSDSISSSDYGGQSFDPSRGMTYLNNNQAYILLLFFVYFLMARFYYNKRIKLILTIFGITSLLLGILSFSRTAIFSLAISIFFYAILYGNFSKKIKFLTAVFVLFISLIFIMSIISPLYLQKLTTIFKYSFSPYTDITGTAMWRYQGVVQSFNQFYEAPLFGSGFGGRYYFKYKGQNYFVTPHNQYLMLLVKTGIFGLTIYLLTLSLPLLYILKKPNRLKAFDNKTNFLFSTLIIVVYSLLPFGVGFECIPQQYFLLGIFFGLFHDFRFYPQTHIEVKT